MGLFEPILILNLPLYSAICTTCELEILTQSKDESGIKKKHNPCSDYFSFGSRGFA